jgi:formylglycine-generating enzyme required for sulfatase activity
MEQKENYATLMRIAMLSSMQAKYTSATMGFRCAADGSVQ